jgi:adenosylcobinamide-phosphate synthase
LEEPEIVRATVETIAESTADGIIAPLVYLSLGGAPLALAYKAVNTLDSMVGHRDERYEHFGWASARLDDVMNWVPAD